MGPKIYLFFISGAKKGRIEFSEADIIRIGRQPYCEVQLDAYQDIPASGNHAQIVWEGQNRFSLIDSGSTWGTWKNDVRIMGRVPIQTGDVITLGQDDRGRMGPQLRFYLDADVLRCPSCSGPVYKRHFRCPTCQRKFCLRCIDFGSKTCKPCGAAAPARAAPAIGGMPPPAPPPHKRTAVMPGAGGFGGGPGGGAADGAAAAAFCSICCDFARGPTFACPSCTHTFCVEHRHGPVCPSCAGVAPAAAFGGGVGGVSEPELAVPGIELGQGPRPAGDFQPPADLFQPPYPPPGPGAPIPPSGRLSRPDPSSGLAQPLPATGYRPAYDESDLDSGSGFGQAGPPPSTGTHRRPGPGTDAHRRPASGAPGTGVHPRPGSDSGPDPFFSGSNIEAQRPPTIPCERCAAPLSPRDFFVCEQCNQRMCGKHQATGAGEACDRCAGQASASSGASPALPQHPPGLDVDREAPTIVDGQPSPPRRDLLETADAEDPPAPPPLFDSDEGRPRRPTSLSGVQFECPSCDSPITPDSTRCPNCHLTL